MALTRKMLKGMGLTEEQIDTIIEGHDETVSGLKDKITDLTTKANQADALKKERDALQKKIDEASGETDWKAEYDKLKADTEAKETASKVKTAYRQLLIDAHVDPDMIDTVMDATRFDDKKLDKDGKTLKDADKLTEGITSKWAKFIVTEGAKTPPVKTPPDGKPAAMTRADIYAKDDRGRYKMSTEERQKALQTHPELMQPGAK